MSITEYTEQLIPYAQQRLEERPRQIHDNGGGYAGEIFRMLLDHPAPFGSGPLYWEAIESVIDTDAYKSLLLTCLTDRTAWGVGRPITHWYDLSEVGFETAMADALFNIAANDAATQGWDQQNGNIALTLPAKRFTDTTYVNYYRSGATSVVMLILRDLTNPDFIKGRAGRALLAAYDTLDFAEALHARTKEYVAAGSGDSEVDVDALRKKWNLPSSDEPYLVAYEIVARVMADLVWAQVTGQSNTPSA